MTLTAFQANAFENDAFQIVGVTTAGTGEAEGTRRRRKTVTATFAAAELDFYAGIVQFDYREIATPPELSTPAPIRPGKKPRKPAPALAPATFKVDGAPLGIGAGVVTLTGLVDNAMLRYIAQRQWQAELIAEEEAIIINTPPDKLGEALMRLSERMRAKRWW